MSLQSNHFHTSLRPKDQHGIELQPLDLVIVSEIPTHYYADPDFAALRNYRGCYGLITYFRNEPFFYGEKDNPGWLSSDGSEVYVLTHRMGENAVYSFDFWLPTANLVKIPYNIPIMSIFSEYPWQMPDYNGPSSHDFVVRGMEQFRQIELILNTPHDELVKAHDAVAAVLMNASTKK
jgi:hypothetical protein